MFRRLRTFIAFLCLGAYVQALGADRDWPVYGGNFEGTKYSDLKQINHDNVRQLKPAWIYRCDDMRQTPASTIQCNPLIIGRRMFITTPSLKLVSLDAATGKELWRFDPW